MSLIRYRSNHVAVVECPPACHTIFIRQSAKTEKYYLSFPWTVFVLFCSSDHGMRRRGTALRCQTHVGFRNSPLTDSDQMLYYPHLYNINGDNLHVCMEATTGVLDNNQLFSAAIETFWNSCFDFTQELHQLYIDTNGYCADPRVAQYADWQRNTHQDAGFVTSVRWQPCTQLINILNCRTIRR